MLKKHFVPMPEKWLVSLGYFTWTNGQDVQRSSLVMTFFCIVLHGHGLRIRLPRSRAQNSIGNRAVGCRMHISDMATAKLCSLTNYLRPGVNILPRMKISSTSWYAKFAGRLEYELAIDSLLALPASSLRDLRLENKSEGCHYPKILQFWSKLNVKFCFASKISIQPPSLL